LQADMKHLPAVAFDHGFAIDEPDRGGQVRHGIR
jgi:hypothetical protein